MIFAQTHKKQYNVFFGACFIQPFIHLSNLLNLIFLMPVYRSVVIQRNAHIKLGTTTGCLGVEPGPSKSSGLCSGKDAAVAYRTDRQTFKPTGCQFIGHHLVPHHGSLSVKVHNPSKLTQKNKRLVQIRASALRLMALCK